jgi:hypothetical protein
LNITLLRGILFEVNPHVKTAVKTANGKSQPPKLLDQVPDLCRPKHYSIRTEQTYADWIKRQFFSFTSVIPGVINMMGIREAQPDFHSF